MDKQKEYNIPGIHVLQMKEIEEQYQLLNRERSRINEELSQEKADEEQINQKLTRFSYLDKLIEWKMLEIENIELWDPDYRLGGFPFGFASRRTGGKDVKTTVRPDLKRCRKRLVKKGRMDINCLKEVLEEHTCSMKSSDMTYTGTLELSDMMECMAQRIQHGNKKRADEMKIFKKISNFLETKESFIEPESHPQWSPGRSKRDTDYNLYRRHHKLSILLEDADTLKRKQNERQAKAKRLKAELQYVRKKINYLNNKLENVDSKILKAYKHRRELQDEKKELVS
ncbi:hypothetical protein HanLR1_Chr00c0132g0718001 [Helianthus annuus]|nr:hypothetical protein HanHA89_Chr17g0712061 [Helianthus annuus]KAJ0823931.1 hypothetical protein HanLR1_Chr00c0132g0718001 [Helianthus annuus]